MALPWTPGPRAGERLRRELIAAQVAAARDDVSRAGSTVSTLLTVSTFALGGLVTFAHARLPAAAAAALWTSAALTAAALITLLLVVRPWLNGHRRGELLPSHQHLLAAGPEELRDWPRRELEMFSRLAAAKHRRTRLAVDLLFAALAALGTAVIIIVTH